MHGTLNQFDWSAARIEELRRLIAAQYSSGQIAKEFGTSRGSIVGKANRLGLCFDSRSPGNYKESARRSSEMKLVRRDYKPRRQYAPVAMAPEPDARNLTFDQLETNDCRYPVTADAPLLFCGQPKAGGSSYCAHHHHKCWDRPRPRERDPRPR